MDKYIDKFSLKGKNIIITGGCGLIGKAFVEACLQYEANVIICDIPQSKPIDFAKSLKSTFEDRVLGVNVDVSSRSSLENLSSNVLNTFGSIDGLVNAHQCKTANFFDKFEDYKDKDWDDIINVNLKGTFLACQILGSWMAENDGGCIVNIPSTYSVVAPNQNIYQGTSLGTPAAYSASKGGVQAFSQYLSTYWASKNVRVNQLTPHGVWNNHEKKFEENFSKLSPLKRMSYNHEVAPALIYLLSDASSYVTGHNLVIDGGWTAW
ncbi:MAG: short-chain dehydrogenase [Candidatus Marinimicrobia bacterium]|nr:short-chain dehydrogenase [Candidatus Neomarinimicrobiota bacterium]